MALSICLTGGIGSGKSLISRVFRHLDIPVYVSDIETKKIYLREDVLICLKEMFGTKIVVGGRLDKKFLADIVFNDKSKLKHLEAFIHPLVRKDYERWKKENDFAPYVIMESAIIFEIGWENLFDKIICINTPMDIVIERLMQRDNVRENKILERMNNQMSTKDKCEKSDFVVNNDNVQLVLPQILEIDKKIRTFK